MKKLIAIILMIFIAIGFTSCDLASRLPGGSSDTNVLTDIVSDMPIQDIETTIEELDGYEYYGTTAMVVYVPDYEDIEIIYYYNQEVIMMTIILEEYTGDGTINMVSVNLNYGSYIDGSTVSLDLANTDGSSDLYEFSYKVLMARLAALTFEDYRNVFVDLGYIE